MAAAARIKRSRLSSLTFRRTTHSRTPHQALEKGRRNKLSLPPQPALSGKSATTPPSPSPAAHASASSHPPQARPRRPPRLASAAGSSRRKGRDLLRRRGCCRGSVRVASRRDLVRTRSRPSPCFCPCSGAVRMYGSGSSATACARNMSSRGLVGLVRVRSPKQLLLRSSQ